MQDHKSIDHQRYRSAALGHAYLLAKRSGVALKALPEGILNDLGITVSSQGGLCTTFDVQTPKGMSESALRARMDAFERELRLENPDRIRKTGRSDKAIMPESWPGKKDIGRAQASEIQSFRAFPAMDEGIRDVLDQYGDRRSVAMTRKGLDS